MLYIMNVEDLTNVSIFPAVVKWLQEISKLLDVNPTQRDILVETNRMITDICVHFVSIEEAARLEVEQKHDKEQQRQDEEELSQDVDELIPDWLRDAIIHLCDTITTHVFKLHAQVGNKLKMDPHKYILLFSPVQRGPFYGDPQTF